MSVISSIESLIGGFTLGAVKEISSKAAHAVLDEVAAKAEGEAGALVISKAAELGITLTPEAAASIVGSVVGIVRNHI